MKILVTGANGFLGHYLVEALQHRGEDVRALVLPSEDPAWLVDRKVGIHSGDIRDPEALREAMQGVDAVFHLAAMMAAWRPMADYVAVNVTGTEIVCRAALKARVQRVVHVSSAMVYRMWVGHPVTEDEPLRPLREPYSWSKAEGDRMVQRLVVEEKLPAVIIRPGTLFGPNDRLNFGRIAARVESGKSIIIGSGQNPVPFFFVTDMVQGLLLALDRDVAVGQVFNIGTDEPITQQALQEAVAHEIGASPPRLHAPFYPLLALGYAAERLSVLTNYRWQPLVTRHSVILYGLSNRISIDKARNLLGYNPRVSVSEGIRLAAAWYRDWRRSAGAPVVLDGQPRRVGG